MLDKNQSSFVQLRIKFRRDTTNKILLMKMQCSIFIDNTFYKNAFYLFICSENWSIKNMESCA